MPVSKTATTPPAGQKRYKPEKITQFQQPAQALADDFSKTYLYIEKIDFECGPR